MSPELRSRQTARTLAVLSGALLLVGASVMSPAGGVLALGVALLAAVPALAWGTRAVRITTTVLALAELALVASLYPQVAAT